MEKIKSRWSLGWIRESLRSEKPPQSSSPTFNQIPPRPLNHQGLHVLSSWMVTLPPLWAASSNAWPLFSMKKFSLVSKYPRAPHYCQISLVIHALVWRERGALQGQWFGAGRSWEQRHKISALSLGRMECGGLRPFPRRPPVPRSATAARDRDPASRTSRGNRGTDARNRRAPSLPAHPQESHSKSDFKSHSLGRVWSFLLWVQGKTAHSWCCSLPTARQGLEQGDFWMV